MVCVTAVLMASGAVNILILVTAKPSGKSRYNGPVPSKAGLKIFTPNIPP